MTEPSLPHYLYRCYDADGALLYIGCTGDLKARMWKHEHVSGPALNTPAAGLHARMTRWVANEYPNRRAALDAEKAAIRAEHPSLNTLHRRIA